MAKPSTLLNDTASRKSGKHLPGESSRRLYQAGIITMNGDPRMLSARTQHMVYFSQTAMRLEQDREA